jgi:hypothetical protein
MVSGYFSLTNSCISGFLMFLIFDGPRTNVGQRDDGPVLVIRERLSTWHGLSWDFIESISADGT